MHLNILKKTIFIGRKKLIFLMLCIGSLFIYNRLSGDNVQRKEVLNIGELINQDGSKLKTNEFKSGSVVESKNLVENCGMKSKCPKNTFPVHIYTGKANNDSPKLCVGEKYVFDKGLNNPGRGFNLAIVDANSSTVGQVRHFDTYESDPTQMELFLEKYLQREGILIIFTNDEASTKLSGLTINMLERLGSSLIYNLKFRSSWYMVTQKGIKGFTPFEKLSLADKTKAWGEVFDERLCIPHKIEGRPIHPDIIAKENEARRDFCQKNSGYGEFCNGLSVTNTLYPINIEDQSLLNHPIYQVPIIVYTGISLHSLPLTLETLFRQPGINPKMVTVFYLSAMSDASKIATLFGMNSVAMNSSHVFEDQMEFVFNSTVESYPDASHLIFLEEDMILSPDFLPYMARMMPYLDKDPTLYSISAWNSNGFKSTSSNPQIVYRVSDFPGLGFMISKTTYVRQMRGRMKHCCSKRPWIGWSLNSGDDIESVVPDVSRLLHRAYEGLGDKTNMLEELFNRERVTSQSSKDVITNPSEIILSNYEQKIESLIREAVILDMKRTQLENCVSTQTTFATYFTSKARDKKASYVLYYKDREGKDKEILKKLCKCFGLFHADNEPPRGLHKGLLRFTVEGNNILLVGSSSVYYKWKPLFHQPLE